MSPLHDIGRILSQVYAQNQSQVEAQPPDVPRLAGGLWAAFKFEEAAAKYKQHLDQHYGFLHILGHNRPVPLEGIFTDVYLYDRPLAQRRLDVAQLEEQFRQRHQRHPEQSGTRRVDGLSLVRTERHLFILGQPGAGKTTFLKHVALQAAHGHLPGIPIFISLKALADSQKPLLDFMAQEMQICGFPEPTPFLQVMFRSGQMLILLDGLDEVTQAQETALNLIQSIENLIRQYSANHFLITCRTAVTDYQFPGFTTVEMSNFSPEQVDTFIHKWFRHEPSLGNNCLQELNRPEHKGLRDLATTPLLLNLLCLTYEEVGHFPQRRVELYEEALNALLVKWDNSRRIKRDEIYRSLSLGRKRQLFNFIAHTTFQQGQYFIPKAVMVRHILDFLKPLPETGELHDDDGEAILRTIEAQHGIIVERARGVYGFAHLTFQEYFVAKYITERGEKLWTPLISCHIETRWHEVFLLTSSMLPEADDFFRQFLAFLDKQVARDSQLTALLAWVTQRINTGDVAQRLLQRLSYTYLVSVFPRARSYLRTSSSMFNLDSDGAHNAEATHEHNDADNSEHDKVEDNLIGFLNDALPTVGNPVRSVILTDFLGNLLVNTYSLNLADMLSTASLLAEDLDLAFKLDLTLQFGDKGAQSRIRALADAVACCLDPYSALDYALVYSGLFGDFGLAQPFIELAQKLSDHQRLVPLKEALDCLVVPTEGASSYELSQFTAEVLNLIRQYRQLRQFELTDEQNYKLENYLQGTLLLVSCLKLATVSDRYALMNCLLVPPLEQSV